MGKLRFGAAENSTFYKKFVEEYAPQNGFTPQVNLYANTTELMEALENGKVDAICTNIMFANENIKLLGRFSPLPVYYITTKGNQALLTELDNAMTRIKLNEPEYETELMAEYFPIFNNTEYTYAEQQYIKNMPEITIGYEVNHEPLTYQNAETGEFAGITRDILDEISKKSGFKFRYEPLPATNVTYDYLKEHKINVVSSVEYNKVNNASRGMQLSTPYLTSEKVFVAKKEIAFDENSKLTLAMATGSGSIAKVIGEAYPNFTIQTYATVAECFEAVHSGRADMLLQNRYVVEPLMVKPIYNDMSLIPAQS